MIENLLSFIDLCLLTSLKTSRRRSTAASPVAWAVKLQLYSLATDTMFVKSSLV